MPRHFGILSPQPSGNREAFLCVTNSITEYQSAKSLGTPAPMPVLLRHPHRMDNGISLVALAPRVCPQTLPLSPFMDVPCDVYPERTAQVDVTCCVQPTLAIHS